MTVSRSQRGLIQPKFTKYLKREHQQHSLVQDLASITFVHLERAREMTQTKIQEVTLKYIFYFSARLIFIHLFAFAYPPPPSLLRNLLTPFEIQVLLKLSPHWNLICQVWTFSLI